MKLLSVSVAIGIVLGLACCKNSKSREHENPKNNFPVIKIKGSESELNLTKFLTDEFKKKYPEVLIDLSGGGSGVGIEALINDEIQIANSSRPISEAEFIKGEKKGVVLVQVIIALDAVAIITHPETGIDSLSLIQVKEIFKGTIKNWKELGGSDIPIRIFGRNNNSGTANYLKRRLMIDDYSKEIIIKNENSEIIESVKNQKGAISYVSRGSIMGVNGKPNSSVWAVNIYYDGGKAYSPYDLEAVKSGEYSLNRPLYQYVKGLPKGICFDLIQFELENNQQQNLSLHGYLPISAIHKTINKKNIKDLNL